MEQLSPAVIKDKPQLATLLRFMDSTDAQDIAECNALWAKITPKIKPFVTGAGQVTQTDYTYVAHDGLALTARLYQPSTLANPQGKLICYVHGGGFTYGTLDDFDGACIDYALASQLPTLALSYRLVPDNTKYDDLVNDVYAGIIWAQNNALTLGVDPTKLVVVGVSSGGALAVGSALLAQQTGMPLAQLLLTYPMLDNCPKYRDAELPAYLGWPAKSSQRGWQALLGIEANRTDLPATIVPARLMTTDILPPTYLEVGTYDIFLDEVRAFKSRLIDAGINYEYHEFKGLPHAFEIFGDAPYIHEIYALRRKWLRQ